MKHKLLIGCITAILLVVAYGIYDIVREVRMSYTSGYRSTYSHAIGQMMGHRFDSLELRGDGVRIGVVDAGFGGFRSDPFTRNLKVAVCRDLTDDDTTRFFLDACDHGTKVTRNIGGYSNDTLLGLAYGATYLLVKADLETTEPRDDEDRLCRAVEWLAQQDADIINISLSYTSFDDFDGYTPQMLDGGTAHCSRFIDSLLDAYPNLIIVQAAGNEGNKKWNYISFPGDVEEVITVGAADFAGRSRSDRSGKGFYPHPIKPDVVVYDSPIGTSFSAPVITGLCAVVAGYERMSRQEMIRLLHACGTGRAEPNLETGYGVPQCDSLLQKLF